MNEAAIENASDDQLVAYQFQRNALGRARVCVCVCVGMHVYVCVGMYVCVCVGMHVCVCVREEKRLLMPRQSPYALAHCITRFQTEILPVEAKSPILRHHPTCLWNGALSSQRLFTEISASR